MMNTGAKSGVTVCDDEYGAISRSNLDISGRRSPLGALQGRGPEMKTKINLSIRRILGDTRLWVGDSSISSCLVSPPPNIGCKPPVYRA